MSSRWHTAIFIAGAVVALAGATLTATGLYAVAVNCGVPAGLAWLYVLSTDGLAVTAYGSTLFLRGKAYPWLIVLVGAVLSALAQGTHLAQGGGTGAVVTETWLRFGVGAWPAISVTIAAHLIYLVRRDAVSVYVTDKPAGVTDVRDIHATSVRRDRPVVTDVTGQVTGDRPVTSVGHPVTTELVTGDRSVGQSVTTVDDTAQSAAPSVKVTDKRQGLQVVHIPPADTDKAICPGGCGQQVSPSTAYRHRTKGCPGRGQDKEAADG
jgi:hypothetical protein